MNKILSLLLLLYISSSYAISSITYGWNVNLAGDTVTASKMKKNYDSIGNFSVRVRDTMNNVVPRWKAFSNHDSTFRWMNIDTIPSADTIRVTNLKVAKIDSVYTPRGVRANSGNFASTVWVDSLNVTKGVLSGKGSFTGLVGVDSLYSVRGVYAPKFWGAAAKILTSITTDSLYASSGIRSASNGNFAGNLACDSIFSTKAIKTGRGRFSDTIFAKKVIDSSVVEDSFHLTFGTFTPTQKSVLFRYRKTTLAGDTLKYNVDLFIKGFSGTSGSTGFITTGSIPAAIRPTKYTNHAISVIFPTTVIDSGKNVNGWVFIDSSGLIGVSRNVPPAIDGSYTGISSSLEKGLYDMKISYPITTR